VEETPAPAPEAEAEGPKAYYQKPAPRPMARPVSARKSLKNLFGLLD
jgi:hypothetical protein